MKERRIDIWNNTYLVQLYFFQTAITLFFVLHIEDLNQFECYDFLILNPPCFKDV